MENDKGLTLNDFGKAFTFVTDSVANMPKVSEASISNSLIPYSYRWFLCISHILNTFMKNALQNEDVKRSDNSRNLNLKKSIVSSVKDASLNDEMEDELHLLQDVATRISSTYDMMERFIKAKLSLHSLLHQKNGDFIDKILKNFSELRKEAKPDGSTENPALSATSTCFSCLRHAQTVLDSEYKTTLIHVLPLIKELKDKLQLFYL